VLAVVVKVGVHAEHVNIVGEHALPREVHGLGFGVTVFDIRLGILEVPGPNDDQIAFTNPLTSTHFPWNASQTGFAVFTQNRNATTAQNLRSKGEHLVDFLVGHFDADFAVAGALWILQTSQFFNVDLFLASSSQPCSPVNGQQSTLLEAITSTR